MKGLQEEMSSSLAREQAHEDESGRIAPASSARLRPRVALVHVADHRDEFYAVRAGLAEAETAKIRELLAGEVELVLDVLVRREDAAREAGLQAARAGADLLALNTPIWGPPHLGLAVARIAGLPVALLSNTSLATSGLGGLLSSGAALDQAGISHRRFFGELDDPAFKERFLAFCRAAAVRARLVGMRFGLLGGFGVGLYSASFDPGQWQKLFGVETSHLDQVELVRRAEAVPAAEAARTEKWLRERLGRVEEGPAFGRGHLERQIRSYLAARELAREAAWDFMALKCQPELSDGYVLQCLGVALLNDSHDADGPKAPLPCACEADADGALTMKILGLLSGTPTALADVRGVFPAENLLVLANCGATAPYFAGLSDKAEDNLAGVHLLPHVFGRAGGGATQFVAAPGPFTLARLCRRDGRYWLAVLTGEAVAKSREELRRSTYPWPHFFVRTVADLERFVDEFGANHLQLAPGDYRVELAEFCRLNGIEFRQYTGGEF